MMNDRLLVLVRHGQSEWNLKNLFTGWKDIDLTEAGIAEARAAGRKLKAQGLGFDIAYTSALTRAQRTLNLMLEEMGQKLPIIRDQALNERDYGDLVGMNKEDRKSTRLNSSHLVISYAVFCLQTSSRRASFATRPSAVGCPAPGPSCRAGRARRGWWRR